MADDKWQMADDRCRMEWAVAGLGSRLGAAIRLPIITSLSVGPNTQARERRTPARVAGLVVDATEILATGLETGTGWKQGRS